MGRGRVRGGGGGVAGRKRQRESRYSFEPYLWRWRRHRGNTTTGCASNLVSSVGGKTRAFGRTRIHDDIFICCAGLLSAILFLG